MGETDLATTHPELSKELVDTDPTTVKAGTNKDVQWVCSKGHQYLARISHRAMSGSGCPYCVGKKTLVGFNDLATTHPKISKELVGDPTKIHKGSETPQKWCCTLGHEYEMSTYNRVKGSSCRVCSGRDVLAGFNDLATTHPKISLELIHPNPEETTYGKGVRGVWKCIEGHNWSAPLYHRTKGESRGATGCPECSKALRTSRGENELVEFLRSNFTGDVQTSDRGVLNGLELDIYLPELKTAIEFNGVYFHSEKFKDSSYHKNKADKCVEAGVRLITVWEDDYNLRKDIVHKMLIHKLGLSAQDKVPARKTVAMFIPNQEVFAFLEDNHIQGKAVGSYYMGLREKDSRELVAVMVLKRTKDVLSLERFATSKIVSGGQSKLLNFVDQNIEYSKMITFADRTVSDGGLYTGTGWVKEADIAPDYRYLVRNVREHKFGYRKDRFKNDPNLKYVEGYTEKQLAELNGLLRVYDAGKVRFSRVPQFRGRIDN